MDISVEWTRLLGSTGSEGQYRTSIKSAENEIYIVGTTNSSSFDGQTNSGV